ncbi:MAG: type II secretion system protein [Phycisphaerae bacterium]|nr:type II secretion system protein [Phycisphaerae bacterium]
MKIVNYKSRYGFTLPEAMAAVVILAITVSSVTIVINRSVAAASDSSRRIRAFQVAREHMETLLGLDSVTEQVEYGITDDFVEWQDSVHSFYEPLTMRMWVEAVCTAEYEDSKGEFQTVELTHWLTDLSAKQLKELFEAKYLKTIEEAAEYAAVSKNTMEQWVDNGMPLSDEGYFIKIQLDLYKRTNGAPTAEEAAQADPLDPQTSDTAPDENIDNEHPESSENSPSDSDKIDCSDLPPEFQKWAESVGVCL